MDFLGVIKQAQAALQREGRITYRTLKRQFNLDDEALEDLKFELIEGLEVATDKDGKMLVWTGGEASEETTPQTMDTPAEKLSRPALSAQPEQEAPASERRQLTVMFCDLVGSTALSAQLDPEELQTVVRTYQEVSAEVIERYEGYIAQYLGDGLLVYFGYPAAHEDEAARAIRAGLEIVAALEQARSQFPQPAQVRIGIHTGPVVVGQMGGGSRHEQLALGETPNIAARVQGKAEPDEIVISAATQRLVTGFFELEDRGHQTLKGISTPQALYQVLAERRARSRFEVAVQTGLTPLVGRDSELGALRKRWTQAQVGNGQVVLLSGEPSIGKSRLVQELKAQVRQDGATQIAFHCSPYHQNSALYPLIEHLRRFLRFSPDETPKTKLAKLQQTLNRYRFPQADTLPLLATLLSLPHPDGALPVTVSPQKHKEQTQAALLAWLIEETEQHPVYLLWEDLHWVDPSTLEVLELLLSQVPTTRLLAILTFRPEFVPPWGMHSYMSHITLNRLGASQVSAMVERVTEGRALPAEVVEQVAEKTDGVPLFVEELTKMIVESGAVRAVNNHYELTRPLATLSIPSTLQDSLMERLDRLGAAKEVAQLGATIGREFSYALLQAVSPMQEAILQHGLQQLVEAELVYQRGLPPQAHYTFKHTLIQDTAAQTLLKRTRQRYHQQIARVLVERFAETVDTQPELLAHHYTEAKLPDQAIPYWQQSGQRAARRSAYQEAINTLTRGLEVLQSLPDSRQRAQQEITLQLQLGATLQATKGAASSEAASAYNRARTLCQYLGETQELFPTLFGLWLFHNTRPDFQVAQELGEQLLQLAQTVQDSGLLLEAHHALWTTAHHQGEWVHARHHTEQGIALYTSQQHHSLTFLYSGHDPGVCCRNIGAIALWTLGYPTQALRRSQEAVTLAQELAHPFSLAAVLLWTACLHQYRREGSATQEQAEALTALCNEQGLAHMAVRGTILRGWALAAQGQAEQGALQMRQSMAAWQATGAEAFQPYFLALLAERHGEAGEREEGLSVLAKALALVHKNGEHFYEAELYRLNGELLLNDKRRMMNAERQTSKTHSPQQAIEAEAFFQQALDIAQQQQAKSWELRAATSMARLWQQQGRTAEARALLAPVYNWFTEGFDTADLKDAKALLTERA